MEGVKIYRFKYFFINKLQKLTYGSGIPENLKKSYLAKIQLPFLILAFFLQTLKLGKNYDIIHANWTIAGLGGLFAAKILRKPFMLTMHGAEIFKLGFNPIVNFLLKRTKLIVINSQHTKNKIEKNYNTKHIENHIIPFGTDDLNENNKYINTLFFHSKFNIPVIQKIVFTLGRLIERKGHKFLIKAIKLIHKDCNDVHLVIAGNGPEKNNLIAESEGLFGDRIHFVDFISKNELPFYFSNADVFVLPAIIDQEGDTEGLGVVNIEALGYKTPVVSTNVGGIADIIKNEQTGLIVEQKNSKQLADAIIRLFRDQALKDHIVLNAYKFVTENLTWKIIGEKYISLYKKHLEKNDLI